jgi:acyl-CoA dehydrogenase
VVDRAVQIHGALGYSGDMPLEMLYRFARHARFVDGADEVHREMVARHVLRAYVAPDDGVPSEHIPKRREEALRKYADVLAPAGVD